MKKILYVLYFENGFTEYYFDKTFKTFILA